MIEVVGVFVGSAINLASRSAMPIRRSAAANSSTPPSEVRRPPSNAAVNFFRWMAGKPNGSIVSTDMAGVARRVRVEGEASTSNP